MTGKIVEIKRFAVHDGDGIRTTVFLKGCSLKCVWCHNPEGISAVPQLAYYRDKCVSCGECIAVCPAGAHRIEDGVHLFDRSKCVACGSCEAACLGEALKFYGREMTVEELMPLLLADQAFYENSGGGVTISGGECLCQADFCAALLKRLKEQGVNTAVDTCGFVSREAFDKVMPYTDCFLYDLKAFDEETHRVCTGQSNVLILENLRYLNACGKRVEIRIPFVPGYNADQIQKIAEFLATLSCVEKVRVLPYHNYAGSKYSSLDMENTLPGVIPTSEAIQEAVAILRRYGISAQ